MDVFNYKNNVKTEGQVASADFAVVSLGKGKNTLVQSINISYSQRIEEVLEVGSPTIFWMPGKPSGQIDIQQLVGPTGFFKNWKEKCGIIGPMSVGVNASTCGFTGKAGINFTGGIVESLSASFSVGKQTITQGAKIRCSGMTST